MRAFDITERVARAIDCAVCGKACEEAVATPDQLDASTTVRIRCHGQEASVVVTDLAAVTGKAYVGDAFVQDRRRGRSGARRKPEWT